MVSSTSPLVSIITPTYNRGDTYLRATMDSVLSQDYPNFEYIVLDDGSSDNTQSVLATYDDPRLRCYHHENMGEVRTVNKGFELAQGDYIVVVNSDDPILPDYIQTAVEFMESHPDILVGYPDWYVIDENGKKLDHITTPEYSYTLMLKNTYCIPGPGAMMRRRVIDLEQGRDSAFRYISDFEFWLRVGLHGDFKRIPHTIATWRTHSETTTHAFKATDEHFRLLDKIFQRDDLQGVKWQYKRHSYASAHYVTGSKSTSDYKQASYHFLLSILIYPVGCRPVGKPRNWSFMFTIFLLYLRSLLPAFIRRPLGKLLRYFKHQAQRT